MDIPGSFSFLRNKNKYTNIYFERNDFLAGMEKQKP